ncbi:hypothetical protein DFH08DRAFT_817588 [Mycena albidolilacea]|uniref:Uncharacterized protein n=1 Tax=Mycena albidolilacea TaxID=1033008 RepID=A0AAD7EID7_9AGAR|nr:hypothetical protein DFH08DRAFT_817588 [Mycena albidolilacea]
MDPDVSKENNLGAATALPSVQLFLSVEFRTNGKHDMVQCGEHRQILDEQPHVGDVRCIDMYGVHGQRTEEENAKISLHDEKFERMSKSILRIRSSIVQRPLRDNTGTRAARKNTERGSENPSGRFDRPGQCRGGSERGAAAGKGEGDAQQLQRGGEGERTERCWMQSGSAPAGRRRRGDVACGERGWRRCSPDVREGQRRGDTEVRWCGRSSRGGQGCGGGKRTRCGRGRRGGTSKTKRYSRKRTATAHRIRPNPYCPRLV